MFRLYAEKNDGQKISSWELFHLTTAFSHFLFPASEKLHRSQAVNKNHNEGPFSDLWWQENLKMCEYLVINLNVKVYLIKHHFSSFQDDDIGCVTPQCCTAAVQKRHNTSYAGGKSVCARPASWKNKRKASVVPPRPMEIDKTARRNGAKLTALTPLFFFTEIHFKSVWIWCFPSLRHHNYYVLHRNMSIIIYTLLSNQSIYVFFWTVHNRMEQFQCVSEI